eukprot:Rhum_TRINITY_DN14618_c26_g1::Rhum_TRINITY_DN14618_c26_g1_i1::g.106055::m.106055
MEFIGGLANNGGMSLQDELATLLILVSEARRKDLERMREEEVAPGEEEVRKASLQQAQRKWACIRQEVLKGLLGDRESAKMVRALFACRYPFLGVLCYEDVTASRQRRAEIVEAENIKLYGCASSLRGGDTPPSSSDSEEEAVGEEEEEAADTVASAAAEAEPAGSSLGVPAPVASAAGGDGSDACRALSDADSIDDIYRDSIAGHDNGSFDHDEYEEADDGESGVLVEGMCFRSSGGAGAAGADAAAPPQSCVVGVLCAAAAAVAAAKEQAAAAERGLVEEAAAAAAAAAESAVLASELEEARRVQAAQAAVRATEVEEARRAQEAEAAVRAAEAEEAQRVHAAHAAVSASELEEARRAAERLAARLFEAEKERDALRAERAALSVAVDEERAALRGARAEADRLRETLAAREVDVEGLRREAAAAAAA